MELQPILDHILRQVSFNRIRVRNQDIEMVCPVCGAPGKFSVNTNHGAFGCFKCPLKGSLYPLIKGSAEARRKIQRPIRAATPSGRHDVGRLAGSLAFCDIADYFDHTPLSQPGAEAVWMGRRVGKRHHQLMGAAYEYCLGRGMSTDQIRKYRASTVEDEDRVYFPYWEEDGRVSFWMGRALTDYTKPKTLEPGTDKPLFGTHVKAWEGGGPLFLVEGVFDHFVTPSSLALMGSSISGKQISTLQKLKPAWVCVIADPDAISKAPGIAERIFRAKIPACYIRWVGTQDDPGKLGYQRMAELIQKLTRLPAPARCKELVVSV